jgi:hypothetical protein
MEWLLARLQEPSTYQGLAVVATAAGVNIAPELQSHIISVGVSVIGLINFIKKG